MGYQGTTRRWQLAATASMLLVLGQVNTALADTPMAAAGEPAATPFAGGVVLLTPNTDIVQVISSNITSTSPAETALVAQSQTGAITLTVAPGITVRSNGAGAGGILAQSGAGPVLVTVNGTVWASNTTGGGNAIEVGSFTAPVSVVTAAGSLVRADGATGRGILAQSGNAVSVASRGTIETTGSLGVAVDAFSTQGSATVETAIINARGFGISAVAGGAGSATVTTTGPTNAFGRAIQAYASGTGAVTVSQSGGLSVTGLAGLPNVAILGLIDQLANTSNVTITSNGPLTMTGVAGTTNFGITASNLGRGAGTINLNGNLTVTAPGGATVSGASVATLFGASTINHAAGSTVTVTGGGTPASDPISALLAESVAGPVTINSAGTVNLTYGGTAQSGAIIARSFNGPVSVNQTGTVTVRGANTFGIGVIYGQLPPFAAPFAAMVPPLPPIANPTTVITARNVSAVDGVGIGVAGGSAAITIQSGGTVNGGLAGIAFLGTSGPVSVTNNGTIQALSSVAIDASQSGGALTLTNASGGTINGAIWGSGRNDVITNAAGSRLVLFGLASDAGAGTDTLTNAGTIATGGATATFNGLETLTNAATGQILLDNFSAGNVLTFAGATSFVGQGGLLGLDVVLGGASSAADRLVIGGAVSGTTIVRVTDVGSGVGTFNPTGILVVQAASASSNAFQLQRGVIDNGLWEYALGSNASGSQWRLVGRPSQEIAELAALPAAVGEAWNASSSRVADRVRADRGTGTWFEIYLDSGERVAASEFASSLNGTSVIHDASYAQTTSGVSAGAQRAFALGGDNEWVLGAALGYAISEQDFDSSDNDMRAKGLTVSAFASVHRGPLSAGLTVHHTDQEVRINQTLSGIPGLFDRTSTEAGTTGVVLDAAWQFDLANGFYVEPALRVASAATSVDTVVVELTPVGFADVTSRRAMVDIEAGRTVRLAGMDQRFWVQAKAGRADGDDNAVAFDSGPGLAIVDGSEDNWSAVALGWSATDPTARYALQARVGHSFGGDVALEGTSIGLGGVFRF